MQIFQKIGILGFQANVGSGGTENSEMETLQNDQEGMKRAS